MIRRVLPIINEKGLHARASAKLVELVERFDARATIEKDGETVAADSIMGLLMLGAARDSEVVLEVSGAEAEALADAVTALIANRFGEDS